MTYYNPQTTVYLDGAFLKASEAKTSSYGQSLHYGYAVFEGIRAYKGQDGSPLIFKAKAHYDRLKASARAIGIPFPFEVEELISATYELLHQNNITNAYIRPLVFCPPCMSLEKANAAHIFIAAWEWDKLLGDRLLNVMISSYQRPNPKGFKINAKVSGHYVNSILAAQEAKNAGYDEALLLDVNGHIAEGPGANVFFEKDGILYTPPAGHILPGITRAVVIEICRNSGIPVKEQACSTTILKDADTAFFCGTAAEIIGWRALDNYTFPMRWKDSLSYKIQKTYQQIVLEK